jgi:hypothetical protein
MAEKIVRGTKGEHPDDQRIITRTSELEGLVKKHGGGKMFDYLGHMKADNVMEEGHNTFDDWENSLKTGAAVTPPAIDIPKKKKTDPAPQTAGGESGGYPTEVGEGAGGG